MGVGRPPGPGAGQPEERRHYAPGGKGLPVRRNPGLEVYGLVLQAARIAAGLFVARGAVLGADAEESSNVVAPVNSTDHADPVVD